MAGNVFYSMTGRPLERPSGVVTELSVLSDPEYCHEESRYGRCYELAQGFIEHNPTWTMVHATLKMDFHGKKYDYKHAFAENSEFVYDPTYDEFHPKAAYYQYYGITDDVVKKYNVFEAKEESSKYDCYGPWPPKPL